MMFKYLFAVLAFPLFLLWYMIEMCAVWIHNTFDSMADGFNIAWKWIDKLPYAT